MQSKTSVSKIDSLKNNKKLHIFLMFLFLSFVFWTLIKLSKNYIAKVEFDLVYNNMPKNKLIQNEPTKTIELTIKTLGFKLVKYGFKKKILNFSLSEIKHKKKSDYYIVTKTNLNNLQAQFSAETVVLKINPDTLYFDLGVKKSKKVKIISDVDLEFKPGFNLVKKYTIKPDVVTVSGPAKIIDSINEVYTNPFNLTDISDSFNLKVDLKLPNDVVTLSTDQISIIGAVEKITEGSFSLPFKVINLPRNYYISTFPKEIKVVYQVALKDYNKISENSFVIQADFKHTEDNNLDYLIPKIIEKPEILYDVKLIPNKIEYLIKK